MVSSGFQKDVSLFLLASGMQSVKIAEKEQTIFCFAEGLWLSYQSQPRKVSSGFRKVVSLRENSRKTENTKVYQFPLNIHIDFHINGLNEGLLKRHVDIVITSVFTLTGGTYHGKLVFPREFPFKPPSIYMITPNGRFKCNTR